MAQKKIRDLDPTAPDDADILPAATSDGDTKAIVLGDVKDHILADLSTATTSVDGLMSHTDKTKIDSIETGAQVTNFARVGFALGAATASVSLNGQKLTSVADPSSAQDAATKAYVDAHAASSPIIWKWNETDATQFTIGVDQQSSCVLSRVAGREGPRLRITFPTKISGNQLTTIFINDLSLPVVNTDVRRYIFEFRLVGVADFSHYTEWYSFGPAHTMNRLAGASHYALCSMAQVGTATRGAKVEAGSVSLSNGTPSWLSIGGLMSDNDERKFIFPFRDEMVQRTPAATKPQFKVLHYCNYAGYNQAQIFGGFSSDIGFVADMGALASGWTSQTLDTVGFAILGGTGTTSNYYFEVDQIVVRKHPMDL